MASELRVNTLKDASGNNSVALSTVAEGSAKSWVNFDGTGTIAAYSFNFSSLTDNGTGSYAVTITNAMANNDFYGGAQQQRANGYAGPKRFRSIYYNRNYNPRPTTAQVLVIGKFVAL